MGKGSTGFAVRPRVFAIPDQFQDLCSKNKYFMSSFLH